MPAPVSATAIMTYSPGSIRSGSEPMKAASSKQFAVSMTSLPRGMASLAFSARLMSAFSS